MSCVVDASVAFKWYLDEPNTADAIHLHRTSQRLMAPGLIVAEVCNAAWRRHQRGEMTAAHVDRVASTIAAQFDWLVELAPLAPRATAIACELAHPVYDCFYLALAEREGAPLVTADARLLARLAATRWNGQVTSLAEYASK